MVLEYGDTSKLEGLPWALLELTSEKQPEVAVRRIGQQAPSIFRDSSFEMFVPVKRRDLGVYEMAAGNYVFVRSDDRKALLRLQGITGTVGLATKGDSRRPTDVLWTDDAYVQGLVAESEALWRARNVAAGAFVRVLDGQMRDMCGTVTSVEGGMAEVAIELKTRIVYLTTPVRNLLDLSHVHPSKRAWYYGPLCDGVEPADIAEDLRWQDSEEVYSTPASRVPLSGFRRKQSCTGLVQELVSVNGLIAPMEIARRVMDAVILRQVRPPKNTYIVYCQIKKAVWKRLRECGEKHGDWRGVVRERPGFRFSAAMIADIYPGTVPAETPPDQKGRRGPAPLAVCQRGHERTSGNVRPSRNCKECQLAQQKAKRARDAERKRKERSRAR